MIIDTLKQGNIKMEKWMWKGTITKLYKDEEQIKIELAILEAI